MPSRADHARRALPPLALAMLPLLPGCATGPRLPLTNSELDARPGRAELVAYLTQPDAAPDACERIAGTLPEDEVRGLPGLLTDGLLGGIVAPETYGGCAAALWAAVPAPVAADLAARTLGAALKLLGDPRLEQLPTRQAELAVAVRAYSERPAAVRLDSEVQVRALRALDRVRGGASSAAPSGRAAAQLNEALQVERGTWAGEVIDARALAAWAEAGDEQALARVAQRLPDADRREDAERRLVQLRIARSPFPDVRADAAAVEARVLANGVNAVALAEHPLREATLDLARLPIREIHVRQRLAPDAPVREGARLLGVAPGRPAPSVLPVLPLRGALQLRLAGLSAPVTLCARSRALDPTPCLPAAEVAAGSGLARVEQGAVRLEDALPAVALVPLAHGGAAMEAALTVGGVRVATLSWPLRFEPPDDLVFHGGSMGRRGPDLDVRVERLLPARLVYTVRAAGGAPTYAVVEWSDSGRFHVVTAGARGGAGIDGTDGTDGLDGLSGNSASCPASPGTDGQAGADGSNGGDGGDGAPGGDGGAVRVRVSAPPGALTETLARLRAVVRSQGGPGGVGGRGGRAGRGGAGGMGGLGATCIDQDGRTNFLAGGLQGLRGDDGLVGRDGSSGPDGRPATITLELEPVPGS